MLVQPTEIVADGAGIDLSNLSDGISIRMADPVEDPKYARNTVTLVYQLADYEQAHLRFFAKEFGDEPHAPPLNPFGNDVDFDGVAISIDGAAWYEIQDLRNLSCDAFTEYDIDLNAIAAEWGLSLDGEVRIRFCQYDNNPAPMDGLFLYGIEIAAELTGPVFHLPMDDNDTNPTVRDISGGGLDQVFIDPTGDPNTTAHSVAGPNGALALYFDGTDDRIDFGPELMGNVVAAGRDFSFAFWVRSDDDPGSLNKTIFLRGGATSDPRMKIAFNTGRIIWTLAWEDDSVSLYSQTGMFNRTWRQIVCRRKGETVSISVNGVVHDSKSHTDYARNLFAPWYARAIGHVYTSIESWPLAMADFRVYSRAITIDEIRHLCR